MAARNSFVGPDPNTLGERDTVMMSPDTFKSTFDSDFRKENPAYAALHAYRHRYQPQANWAYRMGSDYARPLLNNVGRGLSDLFSQGPLVSGGLSGLAGMGTGLLGGLGWNALSENKVNPAMIALLSGLTTGSLGAFGGYLNQKGQQGGGFSPGQYHAPKRVSPQDYAMQVNSVMGKSAFYHKSPDTPFGQSRDDTQFIMNILQNAPGLSFNERAHLASGVSRLSSSDASNLAGLLGAAGGAAAGALIARFLMGRGLISSLLGAVTGGVVGSLLFGNRSSSNTSFNGQQLGSFI